MIDTKIEFLENELNEVIRLFEGGENLNVKHRLKESEGKLVNTITVNGQVFAYGNLVPVFKDEIERKRLIKRYAKLSVYKALLKTFNKDLPWGALTGIRPTKLAYNQIEETGDFEEFFLDVMKVSEQKTLLTKKVIDSQKNIYEKIIFVYSSATIRLIRISAMSELYSVILCIL